LSTPAPATFASRHCERKSHLSKLDLENHLGPAISLCGTAALSFVIPPAPACRGARRTGICSSRSASPKPPLATSLSLSTALPFLSSRVLDGPAATQGDEKSLRPATTLYRTVAPSFVIPSEAEGSAVPRTFRGHVFRQSVPGFPASLHWTRPRMRLSLKERRIMFDNASNFYRKSGVAEWRDLPFPRSVLTKTR
jgi:hypothetical protein